tara:strand:- start:548 stop:727 length:180 start_codon:yes stop_codon:yes gene_type:complete
MKLRVPPTEKNFPGYKTAPRVCNVTAREQINYILISLGETARIASEALVRRIMYYVKGR